MAGRGDLAVRRVVLGAGALIVAAGLAVAACSSSGSDGDGASEPPTSTAGEGQRPAAEGDPIDLSTPGVHELTPPPITERGPYGESLEVVLDGEVAVWGGFSAESDSGAGTIRNDGALLSLDDGRWTPMPAAPFEGGLYQPLGAWDGEELIVIGTECTSSIPPNTEGGPPARCPSGAAAAAFDPASFTWRRLDPPPIPLDETYDAPIVGYGAAAVGGDGQATFAFGRKGTAVVWDGASSSWRAVDGPAPEAERVQLCADQLAGHLVAVIPRQLPDGRWATRFSLLDLGADAWRDTVDVDISPDQGASCGDGYVASSGLLGGMDDLRSEGVLVDVETGATSDAFAASPDLRRAWIVGPWLFAQTSLSVGDLEGGDQPDPIDVRLIRSDGDASATVGQLPEDWASSRDDDQLLPGLGTITEVIVGRDPPGAIWVAPPELLPS